MQSQQVQTCVKVDLLVASRVPPTLGVKMSLSATDTIAIIAFSCWEKKKKKKKSCGLLFQVDLCLVVVLKTY